MEIQTMWIGLVKVKYIDVVPLVLVKRLLASNYSASNWCAFAMLIATTLTDAEIVVRIVEHIIPELLQTAILNGKKLQQAIIYIGEIDKMPKSKTLQITRCSGEVYMQARLKLRRYVPQFQPDRA